MVEYKSGDGEDKSAILPPKTNLLQLINTVQ